MQVKEIECHLVKLYNYACCVGHNNCNNLETKFNYYFIKRLPVVILHSHLLQLSNRGCSS